MELTESHSTSRPVNTRQQRHQNTNNTSEDEHEHEEPTSTQPETDGADENNVNRFADKDNSEAASQSRETARKLLFHRIALIIFTIILFTEGIIAAQLGPYLSLANGTSVIAFFGVVVCLPVIVISRLPYRWYLIHHGIQIIFGVIAIACGASAYNSFPMDLQACSVPFSTFTPGIGVTTVYQNYGNEKYYDHSSYCAFLSQGSSYSLFLTGNMQNQCCCVNTVDKTDSCFDFAYSSSTHCDDYLKTIPRLALDTFNLSVFQLIVAVILLLVFPRYFTSSELPTTFTFADSITKSKSKTNQGFQYDQVDHSAPISNPLQSAVDAHGNDEYEDNSV